MTLPVGSSAHRETRGVPTEGCEHFGAKAAAGGMISLSNRVPGEPGPAGLPAPSPLHQRETPPTEPTGEGAGGSPGAKSRIR